MNNEPVAWMITNRVISSVPMEGAVPLYTHPVSQYKAITNTKIEPTVVSYTHPVKELTDEEIEDECRKAWGLHDQDQLNLEEVFKFARAILRKASEK